MELLKPIYEAFYYIAAFVCCESVATGEDSRAVRAGFQYIDIMVDSNEIFE